MLTLADLAKLGEHGQVAPLLSGVQSIAPNDRQIQGMLIAAVYGRVNRGGGADELPRSSLNALGRKKILKLTPHPGPRKTNWAYGELTEIGWKALKAHFEAIERRNKPLVKW